MLRVRVSVILVSLCLVVPAFAKSHVPRTNTKAAIKHYVTDAAAFVKKHGADCKALMAPEWKSGDYYVFVDEGGKNLCHPNPSLIGKSSTEIIDANGKKVGEALEATAKKGGGWVDYVWPRPGTDKPVAKSTYVTMVKGPNGKTYVVGAGGYELK